MQVTRNMSAGLCSVHKHLLMVDAIDVSGREREVKRCVYVQVLKKWDGVYFSVLPQGMCFLSVQGCNHS